MLLTDWVCVCVCARLLLTFSPICIHTDTHTHRHTHTHTHTHRTAVTPRLFEHKSLLAVTYVGWMLTEDKECAPLGQIRHTHTHLFFFREALKNAVRVVDLQQLYFGAERRRSERETRVEMWHSASDRPGQWRALMNERSLLVRFTMNGWVLFILLPLALISPRDSSVSLRGDCSAESPSVWCCWLTFRKENKLRKPSYWNHF